MERITRVEFHNHVYELTNDLSLDKYIIIHFISMFMLKNPKK